MTTTACAPVASATTTSPATTTPARPGAVLSRPASCIACGSCVSTCPRGAISVAETAVIDARLCIACGMCIEGCSYGALSLAGA